MTIDFGSLKGKIIRLLSDSIEVSESGESVAPIHGSQTSAEILADAVEAALIAVCTRLPKSLAVSYSDGSAFEIPVGLIDIDGVYDPIKDLYIPQVQIRANYSAFGNPTPTGNGWMLFCPPDFTPSDPNDGVISFLSKIEASAPVTLYYTGNWEVPVDDDDVLETPSILTTALSLYGASYCMLQRASGTSGLKQYDTKVDSGKPTDNPNMDMSNHFLKRYDIELSRLPMRVSGVK